MRNLVGLEMLCFCRSKHFTLTYEGGRYVDGKQQPVTDVMDMNCYVCTASFYTREGDAIGYCPNCGHFDRMHFATKEDLVEALRGLDFSWLDKTQNKLKAMMVQTWNGDWKLQFARSEMELDGTGKYQKVVRH